MTVDFTDESTGDVTSWDWDLDDGASATTQDPSHGYDDPGIYDVSLTVTDPYDSDTETKDNYIWVGFPDVPPAHWAFQQVLLCVDADIIAGYPEGLYYPTWIVSRDQMAVYIARAIAGGDSVVPDGPPTPSFPDVATDYWAFKYVEYAVSEDVVQGYEDLLYHPEYPLDRGQMAVFIARARAGGDASVPDGPGTPTFPDVDTDFWAYKYIEYIVAEGITSGYEDLSYHPEYPCSRDQMAVFVQRAFGL